ncbi:hypothetical protein EUGRSUZ_J01779 [Eucalyptus grandis]|uniref:Uncharacterized protein n=2 Tax=Eucalyptus grandis TaxID=71139 RepID=A0ACC3J6P7_EUCGR|nr:hypothetical protein EUGRSUZ_J01779 [Eucalyptus grandis]
MSRKEPNHLSEAGSPFGPWLTKVKLHWERRNMTRIYLVHRRLDIVFSDMGRENIIGDASTLGKLMSILRISFRFMHVRFD